MHSEGNREGLGELVEFSSQAGSADRTKQEVRSLLDFWLTSGNFSAKHGEMCIYFALTYTLSLVLVRAHSYGRLVPGNTQSCLFYIFTATELHADSP